MSFKKRRFPRLHFVTIKPLTKLLIIVIMHCRLVKSYPKGSKDCALKASRPERIRLLINYSYH